ncbi:MAG: T9SS type A sorting domain-containing protein [Bacteroidetes bacterium]|nr:T9SS type A sorting domain-containing protein [Bacteroidota bacterium]
MKKILLSFALLNIMFLAVNAQGKLEIPIIATGGLQLDTLFVEDENEVVIDTIPIEFELSSDDAEQENDAVDTPYDDDLDAGWEGTEGDANTLTCGMRFQNIEIPQGETIDSAYIVVYSHEAKFDDDVAEITIYAEDADSAHTFDSVGFNKDFLLTDRTATTAQVEWTVAEEWAIWKPYRTPDLATIVQELVNRDGWKSGNAIAFIFAGEDQGASDVENAREWEAFENIADPEDEDADGNPGDGQNHPERVPKLVVYWGGYVEVTDIQHQELATLEIYPNPADNGILNINLENAQQTEIEIVDITGKSVLNQSTKSNHVSLNVSGFNSGIYYIKATQDNITYTQKVIIQ